MNPWAIVHERANMKENFSGQVRKAGCCLPRRRKASERQSGLNSVSVFTELLQTLRFVQEVPYDDPLLGPCLPLMTDPA